MIRLLMIAALLISSTARAEVALSTISDLEETGLCLGDQPDVGTAPNWAAAGFTTASVASGLDSIRVRLNDAASNQGAFTATLHAGSDSAVGSAITEIGTGLGTHQEGQAGTFDVYTLTPPSRIPLNANTSYWIVMTTSVSAACPMWFSLGGLDPAGGLFTYLGSRNRYQENILDNSNSGVVQFEISVTRDSDGDGVYNTEDAYPNDPSNLGVTLEEPAVGLVHMGVGNLRGWAVSSAGIRKVEAFLDGEFLGEIPYGGARTDVGLAFTDIDGSDQSGFGMSFNYSGLSAGIHTIEVVAHSIDNKTASDSAQFETVRFDKEFIGAGEAINLNAAASVLTNDQIRVENISIAGKYYNLLLRWRTAEQGFEIVEIEALD